MLWLPFIVIWQVAVPEQGPLDQPANTDPGAGEAVSVTTVPGWYVVSQLLVQDSPVPVTPPEPVPPMVRDSVGVTIPVIAYPSPSTPTQNVAEGQETLASGAFGSGSASVSLHAVGDPPRRSA